MKKNTLIILALIILAACSDAPPAKPSPKEELKIKVYKMDSLFQTMSPKEQASRYEEMVTLQKTFVTEFPDDPAGSEMMLSASKYAREQNRIDDAISFLELYIKHSKGHPQLADALLEYADIVYKNDGDTNVYRSNLQEVINVFPQSSQALEAQELLKRSMQ